MQPVSKQERSAPLRIQHDQGYYAFNRGWLSNQHHPESVAGKEWQRGFNRAYFDNLDKLNGNQAVR
jgi:hypothetical protein